MKRRDYVALMADIRRYRPAAAIVLALVVLGPSFDQLVTQDLSPLAVLVRLVEALVVTGLLVWALSGVVLHYARVQVRSTAPSDSEE
jgi:predicted permease